MSPFLITVGHLSVGGATSIAFLTIATTVLGAVTGVLVYYVTFLTRKKRKLKESSNSTSQPQGTRAVDPLPLQTPGVEDSANEAEDSINEAENGAVKYADVLRSQRARGTIDTRGNMAYQYGQVKQ